MAVLSERATRTELLLSVVVINTGKQLLCVNLKFAVTQNLHSNVSTDLLLLHVHTMTLTAYDYFCMLAYKPTQTVHCR